MKFYTLLLFLLLCLAGYSQVPQAMNYQAVARNLSGDPLVNKTVSLRISITDGLSGGTTEYQETRTAITNQFGLFTLKIGLGTPTIGIFANIKWATGNKYIVIEYDADGGSNYINMGVTQLVSVPYALYAATAGDAVGPAGPQGNAGPTGPAGVKGEPGLTGSSGEHGIAGNTGPTGNQGLPGYEGPVGPQGIPGINGQNGATGSQGIAGTNGLEGSQGATGAQGIQGITGINGQDGATGAQG